MVRVSTLSGRGIGPARPTRRRRRRAAIVLVACGVTACASITPRYGTLDGVVVGNANDPNPTSADVRVARPGGPARTGIGMSIGKSDTISTSRDARALFTLLSDYEITLDTGTVIIIENPSIFVRLGQLFIRKLTGGGEPAVVHTNHTSIIPSGTAFFVKAVSDESAQLLVADGSATASPRGAEGWAPVDYPAMYKGIFRGSDRPIKTQATSAELERELSWVRRVDALTRVRMPRLDSLTEADARAALSRVGLRVLWVRTRTTGAAASGRVIEQSPSAGAYAPVNSWVTLVVEGAPPQREGGAGARAPESPSVSRARTDVLRRVCTVPDIRNKSERDALKLLSDAGYSGRLRSYSGRDYVATQSTNPGEHPACGSTIEYTMAANIR
jgi:hypothetical protein